MSVTFIKKYELILSSLIALICLVIAAKISFELAFSPVPITLQTLAIVLIAFLFEPKQSIAIILIYLLLGLFGVEVFSGDKVGISAFSGATGGFLIGFLLATLLIALLKHKINKTSLITLFLLFVLGHLIISVVGLAKLYFHVGNRFLELGFYPFIPGLFLKSFIASLIIYYKDKINSLFR